MIDADAGVPVEVLACRAKPLTGCEREAGAWLLLLQAKRRFDAEAVSIPFPQTDVHLYREIPASYFWFNIIPL